MSKFASQAATPTSCSWTTAAWRRRRRPTPGDDLSARITLRLPEALKGQIEIVASSEGVSTNAWIVRALARALEPRATVRARTGNRLQGFAQS